MDDTVANIQDIIDACALINRPGFECEKLNGDRFEFGVLTTRDWHAIMCAVADTNGNVDEVADRLSLIDGAPPALVEAISQVYDTNKNAEIIGRIQLPEDFIAETGTAPITCKTLRAVGRNARKIKAASFRKYQAMRNQTKVILANELPLDVLHSEQIALVARSTQQQSAARLVGLEITQLLAEADGHQIDITSELRDQWCEKFGIKRHTISRILGRLEEKGVFQVIAAKHSKSGTLTAVIWSEVLIEELSQRKAEGEWALDQIEEQECSNSLPKKRLTGFGVENQLDSEQKKWLSLCEEFEIEPGQAKELEYRLRKDKPTTSEIEQAIKAAHEIHQSVWYADQFTQFEGARKTLSVATNAIEYLFEEFINDDQAGIDYLMQYPALHRASEALWNAIGSTKISTGQKVELIERVWVTLDEDFINPVYTTGLIREELEENHGSLTIEHMTEELSSAIILAADEMDLPIYAVEQHRLEIEHRGYKRRERQARKRDARRVEILEGFRQQTSA